MASNSFQFKTIVAGSASGRVVFTTEPFSLTGEFNSKSGVVPNARSCLHGKSLAGTIFLYPFGKGSSCTSAVLAEAVRLNTAPAAIINVVVEPILVVGALVAYSLFGRSLPILSVSPDVFQDLQNIDELVIDTETSTLMPR
jgi:uncharacterized protein